MMNCSNKKSLFFLFGLLIVGIVGTTIAYYTSETVIVNQFKSMTYNVAIEEEFNDTWGTKKVSFINKEETNSPIVLRINYNEMWKYEIDGEVNRLSNKVDGENVVTKNWTDEFKNDFSFADDGWFYYNKILNAGESVQVLESIALNDSLISSSPFYNEYRTYDYELDFNFEAIQASETAIFDIWGLQVTFDGDDINWFEDLEK